MSNIVFASILAIPVALFSVLLPVGLVLALQVFLCRRGSRLGLILPALSLLLSLLLTLSVGIFQRLGGSTLTMQTVSEDGQVIEQVVEQTPAPPLEAGQVLAIGGVFLVTNIPTAVLTGIWFYYKNRRDWKKELEKMDIQDLG